MTKPPQQFAQAGAPPDPCLRAVSDEAHDKWLSVKRGVNLSHRYDARMQLFWARAAAQQGNDQACWYRLGLAEDLNTP